MILVVIVIIGVAVEIFHLAEQRGIGLGSEKVGGIKAVVVGSHHLGQARNEFVARVNSHVDLRSHALVALGLDEQHAIGSLGTIEGGTVLQYSDCLNVVDVQIGKEVVEIAVVKHGACVLHVEDHTIDDDERLHIGMQGVDALDEHEVAQAGNASVTDRAHVGTELLRDKRVNAELGIVGKAVGLCTDGGAGSFTVLPSKILRIEFGIGNGMHRCRFVVDNGVLLQAESFEPHGDRPCVLRNFQFIESLFVGHGAIARMSIRDNDDTLQGLSSGSIGDGACDGLGVLLCHCCECSATYGERQDEIS